MCKDSTKCKTIQIGLFNVISGISDACREVFREIITTFLDIYDQRPRSSVPALTSTGDYGLDANWLTENGFLPEF